MFSYFIGFVLIALLSGLSALIDSSFLGYVVLRTGPNIGYGFLTLFGDGYNLSTNNPWSSVLSIWPSLLFYLVEICTIGWVPLWQDMGSLLIFSLGTVSILIGWGSSNFIRGYSVWGSNRLCFHALISEGVSSFLFYVILFFFTWDSFYSMEEDQVSLMTEHHPLLIFYLVLFLFIGESHPGDVPESESECGGGPGVVYGGLCFMIFAILEYRWIIYVFLISLLFSCSCWSWLFFLFPLRGIVPRSEWNSHAEFIWSYYPLIILAWFYILYFVFHAFFFDLMI